MPRSDFGKDTSAFLDIGIGKERRGMHSPDVLDRDVHCIRRIVVMAWLDLPEVADNFTVDTLCSRRRNESHRG